MRGIVHFHPRRSLSARGRLLNTFSALLWCLALGLLALGAYLIRDQFADPVQAPEAGLILGALFVAVAVTVMFALLQPARTPHKPVKVERQPGPPTGEGMAVLARSSYKILPRAKETPEAQHSRYADHILIRP